MANPLLDPQISSDIHRSRPKIRTATVFLVLIGVVVAYLTLVPLALLVWGSFHTVAPGQSGPFTFAKYVEAFSSGSDLFSFAGNTLIFAFCGSTFAFVVGTYFAWLFARTDVPFKPVIFGLMMTPHILPGVLQAFAWIELLSPKIGIINAFLATFLPHHQGPFDIYTMGGMIWTFGVDSITLPFLMMVAAFRYMAPSLEEAARTCGARTGHMLRTVTLPILTPAILATWILIFMHGAEDFEVPGLIGIQAKISVFATAIWIKSTQVPSDLNLASVYAVTYLLPALAILYMYSRVTRQTERYATVTGKNYRPTMVPLGRWRWPLFTLSGLWLAAIVILPFVAIIWSSLIPYYQVPSFHALAQVSLAGYHWILTQSLTYTTFLNSVIAGFSSTTLVVLLSAVIAWIVIRTRWRGRRILDYLAFAPIAVSGTLFGLALIWLYLTVKIPIYDTIWIVVIGFIAKYLPQAMRFSYASMTQVHHELEEASAASGAGWGTTFRRVLIPLMMPGMIGAWIYVIALTFKVLSLPIMLSGPNSKVLSVLIFDLAQEGQSQQLAALGVMLVILLAMITVSAQIFSRKVGDVEQIQ